VATLCCTPRSPVGRSYSATCLHGPPNRDFPRHEARLGKGNRIGVGDATLSGKKSAGRARATGFFTGSWRAGTGGRSDTAGAAGTMGMVGLTGGALAAAVAFGGTRLTPLDCIATPQALQSGKTFLALRQAGVSTK
jgi:hypothetical protein